MRLLPRSACSLALILACTLIAGAAPAIGAANHVVISEFATRGPTSATEEFVEL